MRTIYTIIVSLVLSATACGADYNLTTMGPHLPESPQTETAEQVSRVTPIVRVANEVVPKIVSVYGNYEVKIKQKDGSFKIEERSGQGSGFIVDSRGYIVTCEHVVKMMTKGPITVRFFGRTGVVEAKVVGVDKKMDVAVLKVTPSEPLDTIKIGTASDLMLGEHAIAVGNPHGYTHSISIGYITGLRAGVQSGEEEDAPKFERSIQTNCGIQPGNSGGALVNVRGELIGMCECIHDEVIGFATPVEDVMAAALKITGFTAFQVQ